MLLLVFQCSYFIDKCHWSEATKCKMSRKLKTKGNEVKPGRGEKKGLYG